MVSVPIRSQLPHVLLFQLKDITKQWQRLWTRRKGCTALPSQEYENENGASKKSDECFVHHVVDSPSSTCQTARGRGLPGKRSGGIAKRHLGWSGWLSLGKFGGHLSILQLWVRCISTNSDWSARNTTGFPYRSGAGGSGAAGMGSPQGCRISERKMHRMVVRQVNPVVNPRQNLNHSQPTRSTSNSWPFEVGPVRRQRTQGRATPTRIHRTGLEGSESGSNEEGTS